MKFEWISAPPAEGILRALEALVMAGVIGEDGRLTVMGQRVAECPIELRIARMVTTEPTSLAASELLAQLFSSKEFSCGEEILTIAAMISVQVCRNVSSSLLGDHMGYRMCLSYQTGHQARLLNSKGGNLLLKKGLVYHIFCLSIVTDSMRRII